MTYPILSSHLEAHTRHPNSGYTWTLTSRLGNMLYGAETLYGERDKSWTILGWEFGPSTPQIWYPENCKTIIIQLSKTALLSNEHACYQMAHECIHLLAPVVESTANVLEEGLATVFSEDYVWQTFNQRFYAEIESYTHAANLVRELLSIDANAIQKLRVVESSFLQMSSDTFHNANIAAPFELVTQLLSPFHREA